MPFTGHAPQDNASRLNARNRRSPRFGRRRSGRRPTAAQLPAVRPARGDRSSAGGDAERPCARARSVWRAAGAQQLRVRLQRARAVRRPADGRGLGDLGGRRRRQAHRSDGALRLARRLGIRSPDRRRRSPGHRHGDSTDGRSKSLTFPLTATDCQPARTFAEIGYFGGGTHSNTGSSIMVTSSLQSDRGPTMRSVAFEGSGISAAIPSGSRGRVAGKLVLSTGARGGDHTYVLRVARSGANAAASRRAERHAAPRGRPRPHLAWPARLHPQRGHHADRPRRRDLLSAQHVSAKLCRDSLDVVISGPEGQGRIEGGRSSGLCVVPSH